jgi:hypothetical protein
MEVTLKNILAFLIILSCLFKLSQGLTLLYLEINKKAGVNRQTEITDEHRKYLEELIRQAEEILKQNGTST